MPALGLEAPPMPSNMRFQHLPVEIHGQIASGLTQQETLNLCLASKRLYDAYLRFVYRSVDLSLHHQPQLSNKIVERIYHEPQARFNFHDERVLAAYYHAQTVFIQALDQDAVRADWVQDFRWTILPWGLISGRGQPIYGSENQLGKFLMRLKNVKHVDLANGPMDSKTKPLTPPPDHVHLFPAATSVHLCGIIERRLVDSILRPEKFSRVRHLVLDDLQDLNPSVRHLSRWDIHHRTEAVPALGLLTQMKGRCQGLQSLAVRIPWSGWMHCSPHASHAHQTYDQLYVELAEFLDSVRDTLETFVLDRYQHGWPNRPDPDIQCGAALYPILSSGSWPQLRLLCINKGEVPKRAYPNGMIEQVKRALGSNVECILPKSDSFAPWCRTAQYGNVLERMRAGRKQ